MKETTSSAYFVDLDFLDFNEKDISSNAINHSKTWIAHRRLINNKQKSANSYQQNRQDVRELLSELLDYLCIEDVLCESCFPYRLKHLGYFVCFSHSPQSCAVILSKSHSVGIDVENQEVPEEIAKRHFSQKELAYLSTLSLEDKNQLIRTLWQLKECLIKINQQTLFVGLKTDFSFLLPSLYQHKDKQQFKIPLDILNLSNKSKITNVWIDNQRNIVALY